MRDLQVRVSLEAYDDIVDIAGEDDLQKAFSSISYLLLCGKWCFLCDPCSSAGAFMGKSNQPARCGVSFPR